MTIGASFLWYKWYSVNDELLGSQSALSTAAKMFTNATDLHYCTVDYILWNIALEWCSDMHKQRENDVNQMKWYWFEFNYSYIGKKD